MRAILVGTGGERDRLRWRLEGTGVTVVGEFATVADARTSGIAAEAIIISSDPQTGGGPSGRRIAPLIDAGAAGSAPPGIDPRDSRDALDPIESLTPRELEVLELLAEGLPNKVIADRLGISDQTVKFHVAQITGKLAVANRTEAVRRAIRRGLITI